MPSFSREARERSYRAIKAAEIIREKAPAIERASAAASEREMVIAVVQSDLTFGGVWTLDRDRLLIQIDLVEEEQGWSLLFGPQTTVPEIVNRCMEFAKIAFRRWELMQRIDSRQP